MRDYQVMNKTRKLPDDWPMMRHAVACPKTTRTFTNVAVDEDGNLVQFEEMVHQHDVYRLKTEAVSKGKQQRGKKKGRSDKRQTALRGKADKADRRMFWRGAFIGMVS